MQAVMARSDEPGAHVAEYTQHGSRWDVRCSCGRFHEHTFLRVAAQEAHQRHLRQVVAPRPRRPLPRGRDKPATEPDRKKLRQHRPTVKQYGQRSWAVVCACRAQCAMGGGLDAALGRHLEHLQDAIPRLRELVAGHATGVKQVGDHWLVVCRCGWKPPGPLRARDAAIAHFDHLIAAQWDELPAPGPVRAARQPDQSRRGRTGEPARRQKRPSQTEAKAKPRPPVIVAVSLAEERDRRRLELLRRLGAPLQYGDDL